MTRRAQQHDVIRAGLHPLSLTGPRLALHAGAPADGLDEHAPGHRCGSCKHRVRQRFGGPQTYPKCVHPAREHTGGGPAADVRAWWPACVDYQPRTPGGREAGPS